MLPGRRSLLAAAALFALGVSAAQPQDAYLYRVGGEVTPQNFSAFASFASNSVDQFVGLKISLPGGTADDLTVANLDGLLMAHAKDSDIEISFPSGWRESRGRFFVEGYYKASYAGLKQGITAIAFTPARAMDVEAAGKPLKNIEIDKLQADMKKS